MDSLGDICSKLPLNCVLAGPVASHQGAFFVFYTCPLLPSAILAQSAFSQAAAFVDLCEPTRGRTAEEILKLITRHLAEQAKKDGRRAPLKTTLSKSLQQGLLAKMKSWGGDTLDMMTANFVAHLTDKQPLCTQRPWQRKRWIQHPWPWP